MSRSQANEERRKAAGTVMYKCPLQKKARHFRGRKNPVQLQWRERQEREKGVPGKLQGEVTDGGKFRDFYVRLNSTSELTGFVNADYRVSYSFPIFN